MQAKLPGGNGHLSPNLHINEIAYLGAHNSPMSKCYGWKYTQQNVSIQLNLSTFLIDCSNIFQQKSHNHILQTVTEQFEKHGARHFKFPLHWHLEKGVPQVFFITGLLTFLQTLVFTKIFNLTKSKPLINIQLLYLVFSIVIAHEGDGGSNCKLSVLQRLFTDPESACHRLKELFNLAYKYPNEIMIIKIESKLMEHTKENGTLGWNESDDDLKLHNLLVELNAPQRAITFQDNNPPTLGWCRENQKNILITIEPRRQIGDFLFKYTHYSYDISGQVNYNLDPLEDVKNGDLLNGKIWNPFLEIHLYSENALKQKLKQKLPFVTDKYNDYSHVKKRFKQFNTHCNKMPNFVLADYVDQGNPSKTIDEANDIINKHGCFKPELQLELLYSFVEYNANNKEFLLQIKKIQAFPYIVKQYIQKSNHNLSIQSDLQSLYSKKSNLLSIVVISLIFLRI